ncbi:unnamed protein product [Cladocopium goreaui]|uniref:Protein S-acyltransferase n=1 Tax=Cladocopium goreaui TaxID=2562237 RepID=A0A9P1DUM5_9DINO|nr:unnamed protein product [Cladocopium goreaui]
MSSDDFPTPGWEERFPEPLKFLPVAFIVAMIVGLYSIYVTFHLKPRMEDPGSSGSAYFDAFIFHLVTFMLVFCYILCVFVHPGTIPDKEEDPSWEYDEAEGPQPIAADFLLNMQAWRAGEPSK